MSIYSEGDDRSADSTRRRHLTDEMAEHYTHIRDEARRKAVEALDAANRGTVQ